MHPFDIVFKLNETEKLIVDLEKPFEQLPCYCQTTVSFYEGVTEYILTLDDDLESSMSRFSESLAQALNGELSLHDSLREDIGYLHNEYLKYALNDNEDEWQLNPNLVYEDETWVGFHYQIWSCRQWAAWIYNDKQGEIIFEITSRYPGFFVNDGGLVVMPSYEEWIQTYQPTITRVIPKDIALQWLKQASQILVYIKKQFDKFAIQEGDDQKMVYKDCPRR